MLPLASAAHAAAAAAAPVPISRATRRVTQKRRGLGGGVPGRRSLEACGAVRRASAARQMPTTASATGTVMRAASVYQGCGGVQEASPGASRERARLRLALLGASFHNATGGDPHGANRARA